MKLTLIDHIAKTLFPKLNKIFIACIKQECIPVGCVPAARGPYAGVCFRGGVLHPGGGSPAGGVLHLGGGGAPSGGGYGIPACTEADTLPPLWTDTHL